MSIFFSTEGFYGYQAYSIEKENILVQSGSNQSNDICYLAKGKKDGIYLLSFILSFGKSCPTLV